MTISPLPEVSPWFAEGDAEIFRRVVFMDFLPFSNVVRVFIGIDREWCMVWEMGFRGFSYFLGWWADRKVRAEIVTGGIGYCSRDCWMMCVFILFTMLFVGGYKDWGSEIDDISDISDICRVGSKYVCALP